MTALSFQRVLRVGGIDLPPPTDYDIEEEYVYSEAERSKTGKFIGDPIGIAVIVEAHYDFFPISGVSIINSQIRTKFRNGQPIVTLTYNDLDLSQVTGQFYYKGGKFKMSRQSKAAGGYNNVTLKFVSEELL